jgi:hypothetical protein
VVNKSKSRTANLSSITVGQLAPVGGPALASRIGYLAATHPLLALLGVAAGTGYIIQKKQGALESDLQRYWRDIVDEKHVLDYGIVDGGGLRPQSFDTEPPYDQVHGKQGPLPGLHALFRTTRPIVSAALIRTPLEKVRELANRIRAIRLRGLGSIATRETVEMLFAKADINLAFSRNLYAEERQILKELGGIISSSFVEELLLDLPLKYHTVASIQGKHIPLDNSGAVALVREKSRAWNRTRGLPSLDENVRYEIWESKKIGSKNVTLGEPIIKPHLHDGKRICDGVHVVVAKNPIPMGRAPSMVFAAQPLHSLGTICSDFFLRPEQLLRKAAASQFAKEARKAFRQSEGRGFEAVVQVTRPRNASNRSPRIFEGIPGDECEVTVLAKPIPLVA